MPTSDVSVLGPYDLTLQDKATSPSTTLGLMLDVDEQGAPRVREFRAPPLSPRQAQGFMAESQMDPLVDYIFVQDDWSGGAIRPYYREKDRRYAEAHNVDARWEGALALGMNSYGLGTILENPDFEVVPSGWTLDSYRDASNDFGTWVTTEVDTGTRQLKVASSASTDHGTGGASTAQHGSQFIRMTMSGTTVVGSALQLHYVLPDAAAGTSVWAGRSITIGGYFRGQNSVANYTADFRLKDSVATTTGTSFDTSTLTYTWRSVTRTINAAATAGSVQAIIYFTCTVGPTVNGKVDVDNLTFTVSAGDVALPVVDAAGKQYTAAGPVVVVWDTTYNFWRAVHTHTGGATATGIASYKGKVYVGFGLAAAYAYGVDGGTWTEAAGGSGADNYAQFFTVLEEKLWKNETANRIRYSTAATETGSSWTPSSGTDYQVGDSSITLTGLYALNGTVVPATNTGLFAWLADELRFRNVVTQFTADLSTDTFKTGLVRGSWLYLITAKQGLVRFNGYQLEDLSELFISPRLTNYGGRVRALTQDGTQIYLLLDTPTADSTSGKTVKLASLRQVGDEWQLHILANVDIGDISSIAVAGNWLHAFGRAYHTGLAAMAVTSIRWALPQKSVAPYADDITVRDLITTGTINLPIFPAADVVALNKVELLVQDTDTNNTVAVKYGIDGAAATTTTLGTITTDTTSAPARVTLNASSLATPTNAKGRFWQFQLVLTRNSAQAAGAHVSPKVYAFVAHFVLAPAPVPAWEVYVRLMAPLRNGMMENRSKSTILSNFDTLENQAYPITLVEDFDQDSTESKHYVRIRDWERVLEDPEVHKGKPAVVGELYRLVLQEMV